MGESRLDQRQGVSPMADDMGVGGSVGGSAGPLGGGVPCVEARALVLTQRLRYPVAFPPASEIAWIIPSPANQWYLVSSDGTSAGFGPFRSNCPSRSGGTTPLTSSSWSSVRSTCTGAKFPSRYGLGNAGSSPWGPTGPDGRGTDRSETIPVTSGDVDERLHLASHPTWQAESMADLVADLRFRGLIHQMTDPTLGDRLEPVSLTAYTGFDPTGYSLHVGDLLQVCTLRRLQSAGHRPIAVAGGGTGFVGDPGGKSEERTLLDDETLEANLDGIRAQLSRFIDLGTGDHSRSGAAGQQRALVAATGAVRVPARRGQALHRQPDGGQGLGEVPAQVGRSGHFLHRVQLHAPPGLRLPPPVRCLRVSAPSGRQRSVGEHHDGDRAGEKDPPGPGLGNDHPTGPARPTAPSSGRRRPGRSGSTPGGPAGTSCINSSSGSEDAVRRLLISRSLHVSPSRGAPLELDLVHRQRLPNGCWTP